MKIKKKVPNKKLWQITASRIKQAKRKLRDRKSMYIYLTKVR